MDDNKISPERFRELVSVGKLLALESALRTIIGSVAAMQPDPDRWLAEIKEAGLRSAAQGPKAMPGWESEVMFTANHRLIEKLFAPLTSGR